MTDKLRSIIAEQLGCSWDKVVPEARLVEDLGADSLDALQIILEIENEFAIEIPDQDAQDLKTAGQVEEYVRGRMS